MGSARVPDFTRRRRRLRPRDALVLVLPVLALALYLFGAATLDYHRIRQFDDWWSNATSVRKFGWQRVQALLNVPRATRLREQLRPEDPYRAALRFRVDPGEWRALGSAVTERWGEWIDVELLDGPDLRSARVRFRGDGSAHWTSAKKSLTVRVPRGQQAGGFRELALSVKDVLPQQAVNALAHDFDMLAPETFLLPVYVNESFYGLHRAIEPVDESFLRRHQRLPGNIFRGDAAERGEYFKGVPRELFLNPALWDRVARNDRPGAIGSAALEDFLRDLNGRDEASAQRLWTWMERPEIERLLALLLLAGDPYHMSGVHNQLWYEDPASGRLHPIVWDLRLLDLRAPPMPTELNRFWRTVLADARVLQGALRELARQLDAGLLERVEARLQGNAEQFAAELAYDTLRAGAIPPVGDALQARDLLRSNAQLLRDWIDDARARSVSTAAAGVRVLDIVCDGRAAVRLEGLELAPDPAFDRDDWELWADADLDGARGAGDRRIALARNEGSAWSLAAPTELLPGCGGSGPELAPEPLAYRFFLVTPTEAGSALDLPVDAPPAVPPPGGVTPVLSNALTGARVAVGALEVDAPLPPGRGWHPWRFREPEARTLRWEGEVKLDADVIVGPRETLEITAGTIVRLAPDVSILCKGKLLARGLPDQPIQLLAADPARPWGTLALQGSGADGSLLRHVRLERGGGDLLERVEYTGMVCVHYARGVRFEDCDFGPNLRCDDAFHADKADVWLVRCRFEDANSDAVDFDMSSGGLYGCLIERSRNDGIDCMTCAPRILACRIVASGDKGVSVGEDSSPLIFATQIEGCVRGLEIKDRSRPWILHSRLAGNTVGVLQQVKNWRYGAPGWARLVGTSIERTETPYLGEDNAYLTLTEALAGEPGERERAELLPWIARLHGLEINASVPGIPASWREVAPARIVAEHAFAPDFLHPTDGWIFDGHGVHRLVKRREGLVAELKTGVGRIGVRLDWDLPADSRHVLVLELSDEGLGAVTAHVSGPGTAFASRRFAPGESLQLYRIELLPLEPGRYSELTLELEGRRGTGRLALKGWQLLSQPVQPLPLERP